MRFTLEITRSGAPAASTGTDLVPATPAAAGVDMTPNKVTHAILTAPPESGRWVTLFDSYSGAFQQDVSLDQQSVVRQSAVFRCIALISGDIAKLALRLMELRQGVWQETVNPAYSPFLRRQNPFQTRLEFVRFWLCSLLLSGNTYVLVRRDGGGVVRRATVLEPSLVTPLISPEGDIFYRIDTGDALTAVFGGEPVIIPARNIIHDKYICLNHPLIGNSPLQVAGAAALGNQKAASYSSSFFTNRAMPSGILEAPEGISEEQARDAVAKWQTYTSGNSGKVAVLESGLKFTPLSMKAVDAQLIEQLRYNQEDVARAFGVPAWKIGAGPMPTANNAEISERGYYSQTLQVLIESMELLLDEALGLTNNVALGVEFDLRGLLRTDSAARMRTHKEGISAGVLSPNEARAEEGYGPVSGGDTPYLQQQNFSLAALAKRDAKEDPFASSGGPKPAQVPGTEPGAGPPSHEDGDEDVSEQELSAMIREHL